MARSTHTFNGGAVISIDSLVVSSYMQIGIVTYRPVQLYRDLSLTLRYPLHRWRRFAQRNISINLSPIRSKCIIFHFFTNPFRKCSNYINAKKLFSSKIFFYCFYIYSQNQLRQLYLFIIICVSFSYFWLNIFVSHYKTRFPFPLNVF